MKNTLLQLGVGTARNVILNGRAWIVEIGYLKGRVLIHVLNIFLAGDMMILLDRIRQHFSTCRKVPVLVERRSFDLHLNMLITVVPLFK